MDLFIKKFDELTLDELYDIMRIRVLIFVVEQKALCDELDGKDKDAYHLFFKDSNKIVAYSRVLTTDSSNDEIIIGRVLSTERKKGLGSLILDETIKFIKEKYNPKRIKIAAQTYAVGFYQKHGFVQVSDEFIEDTLPHVYMILEL